MEKPPSNRSLLTALTVLALSTLLGAVAWAGTCTGVVYLDANANGQRDAGEDAVAGCTVSADCPSAAEPVFGLTDETGRYRLSLPDGPAVIFIINPSQRWPTDRWWHYTPDGSGEVDFGLRVDQQTIPFHVVHGTDMHIHPACMDNYRGYLDHVTGLPIDVAFVLHTGDMVRDVLRLDPDDAQSLFDLYIDSTMATDRLGAPVRNLPGNHEVVGLHNDAVPLGPPRTGKDLYRRLLGPTTNAFVYAGYHIIALDATRITETDYAGGLTDAGAAWAAAYLERIEPGSRVILALHEGFGSGPAEQRVLDALSDKRLAVSVYGHGHRRAVTSWGGAPYIQGGAVSYAWHGLLPFPPQPYGYSVMRFGDDGLEDQVFLDWAETCSFDIISPPQAGTYGGYPADFPGYVSGEVVVEGVVSDLSGSITDVHVAVGDIEAGAVMVESTRLKKRFEASLDLSALSDGTREIIFTAKRPDGDCTERQPLVVINGRSADYTTDQPATLRFRARADAGTGLQVLVNETQVADLTAEDLTGEEAEMNVDPEVLERLNTVELRARGESGTVTVNRIRLAHNGREYRDARFSPAIPRRLTAGAETGGRFVTYVDLEYDGLFSQ